MFGLKTYHLATLIPGANPTTSMFSTPALCYIGYSVFQSIYVEENVCFPNALGYLWRCMFLQRWHCS
jgi:hypothetical protein